MKEVEISIDGKKVKAIVQNVNGTLWAYFNGQTHSYKKEKKTWGAGHGLNQAAQLKAPMPGKVVKVLFSADTDVQQNETVIVMEAMKMEYSLKATHATKIKKILCHVGDQVLLGQVLCEFEN